MHVSRDTEKGKNKALVFSNDNPASVTIAYLMPEYAWDGPLTKIKLTIFITTEGSINFFASSVANQDVFCSRAQVLRPKSFFISP